MYRITRNLKERIVLDHIIFAGKQRRAIARLLRGDPNPEHPLLHAYEEENGHQMLRPLDAEGEDHQPI